MCTRCSGADPGVDSDWRPRPEANPRHDRAQHKPEKPLEIQIIEQVVGVGDSKVTNAQNGQHDRASAVMGATSVQLCEENDEDREESCQADQAHLEVDLQERVVKGRAAFLRASGKEQRQIGLKEVESVAEQD